MGQASAVILRVTWLVVFPLQNDHAGYCETLLEVAGAEGGGR